MQSSLFLNLYPQWKYYALNERVEASIQETRPDERIAIASGDHPYLLPTELKTERITITGKSPTIKKAIKPTKEGRRDFWNKIIGR